MALCFWFWPPGGQNQIHSAILLLNKWLDHPQIFNRGMSSKDTSHDTRLFLFDLLLKVAEVKVKNGTVVLARFVTICPRTI
jgi:hypothetical protein